MPASKSIYPSDYVYSKKYCGGGGFYLETGSPSQPRKKNASKSYSFLSLNSQHCQAAAANLCNHIGGKDNFFLFLQEPYLRGGKVAEMQGLNPLFAEGTNPRAAIIGAPTTNVWFCPDFSGRDICTVVRVTGTQSGTEHNNNSPRIYLVSMYLGITSPVTSMTSFPQVGWNW